MRGLNLTWLLWYCNCLQREMRFLVSVTISHAVSPSRMEIPKQFKMETGNDVVRGYVTAADSDSLHKGLHIRKHIT